MARVDPREQFSKKLASRTAWFWFGFMAALVVALIVQPESGYPAVYLGLTVSAVMIVNVWAYTRNSTYEKALWYASQIKKSESGENPDDEEEGDENG